MPKRSRGYNLKRKRRSASSAGRRKVVPRTRRYFTKRKPLARQTHTFSERAKTSVINLNNSTLTPVAVGVGSALTSTIARTFQISDLGQFAYYAELFEYYMIHKVVVTFRYKCGGVVSSTSAAGQPFNEINPLLIFKVDHNDKVAQTLDVMKASSRTKEKQLTNDKPVFSIVLKPAVQAMNYESATATAYVPKWNVWLNCSDPTVPHYALKVQCQTPTQHPDFDFGSILIETKYYFSCKNNE